MTTAEQTKIRLIAIRAIESRTSLKKSTLYDWMNPASPRYKPDFPKPVYFAGSRAVRWVESEVDAFLAAQVDASRSAK